MSQNNTIYGSARRNSSPELWIPYVLIGVSCVTFLAVHFWCYHKRNRERYLRKRDETRVKSGLLERRRITTLMLAKYQSDLGIIPKDKPVDLTRLFYDNTVDVIFDEYDYYRNISRKKHHAIHSSIAVANETYPSLPKTHAATSSETVPVSTKTIASSQTWPLVTERKNMPYNAHRRSSKDDSAKESALGTTSINSYDNGEVIYTPVRTDKQKISVSSNVLMPQGETITDKSSINNTQRLLAPEAKSEQDSTGQVNILRLSSPPASYPRIFYTSLTSSPSAQTSFLSLLTPKHKKRRCLSSPEASISDQLVANENIASKPGEFSTLYDLDADCSVYSNCEDVMLENCQTPCYRQNDSTEHGFLTDGTLPLAEGGHEYRSICYNSESNQAQIIPFSNKGRNNSQGTSDQTVVNICCGTSQGNKCCGTSQGNKCCGTSQGNKCCGTSQGNKCCCTKQGNPLYCLQSDQTEIFGTNTSIHSPTGSDICNSSSSPRCLYQQNVIIPFPEKSLLNIISKNPRKTRANARGVDPTNIFLSTPRPGKDTKRNTIDCHSNIQKLNASKSRSHQSRLIQESLPLFSLSDTPSAQDLTSGFSFDKDVSENMESYVDYGSRSGLITPNNNDTSNTTPERVPVCNTIAKTPTLRSLDTGIIFQNTKRKLGVNSE